LRSDPKRRFSWCELLALALLVVATVPALAADSDARKAPAQRTAAFDRCAKVEPLPGTPVMPVGYFFGFTDPTDSGDPCTSELVLDNIAHLGKRDGRYFGSTMGAEISYTVMHNIAVAAGIYGTYTRWNDVTVLQSALASMGNGVTVNRLDMLRFDGLSVELFMRVLERAPRQPFAMTISVKPRWSAVDNTTGYPAQTYGSEFKLLMDVVLAERLFAAGNFTYGLAAQKFDIANAPWLQASVANASAALTGQVYAAETHLVRSVFLGAELRYRSVFEGLALNRLAGNAFFAGPTLAIGFPNERMISLAWTPQISGRSRIDPLPGSLDLAAYERHELRLKFATPVPLPAH
jgi:hypothetical protein